MTRVRTCRACGADLKAINRTDRRTCDDRCRQAYMRRKRAALTMGRLLTGGTNDVKVGVASWANKAKFHQPDPNDLGRSLCNRDLLDTVNADLEYLKSIGGLCGRCWPA